MKKYYLLYLLSLFLLASALITRAQVTKTVNGIVKYESGMSKTTFNTPNGDIRVSLPQSLSGATITGTVSTEPAGTTEKEKNRNLKELLKFVVQLDGQKIPLSATPTNFDWLTNQDRQLRTPMELLNVSGTKVFELSLPPILPAPLRTGVVVWHHGVELSSSASDPVKLTFSNAPRLTTPFNVLVKGDALNIYTDQQFKPGEKFVLTDSKGQQFTLSPVCLSSQQAVMNIPEGASPGNCNVYCKGYMDFDRIIFCNGTLCPEVANFNLIDINLSSPNTNLRPRQESYVVVQITFQEGMASDARMPIAVFSIIDIKNLNPNIVTMEGGNFQRLYLDQYNTNPSTGNFEIKRGITGKTVGSFSVSATLHENFSTSNDPFRPQLNVLKTPEDFNEWSSALKKDLNQFAILDDDGGPTTQDYSAIKANIQRAIDNMPLCRGPEQLDECKAVAYSLVQPLNVPKGAAISWGSSYESFKSMINSSTVMTGVDDLPDWDVIQNGLHLIQRIGYKTNDPAINSEADNAGQLLDKCRETVPSANQLEQLKNSLQTLVKTADSKIKTEAGKNSLWNLSNLLYDTYCLNKRTRDGIDPQKSMIGYLDPKNKVLKVKPEYQQQILNSLNAVPSGNGIFKINAISETRMPVNYNIQLMPFVFFNTLIDDAWALHLIREAAKDKTLGDIIDTTRKKDGTWYIFYENARCEKWSDEESTIGCGKEIVWDKKEKTMKEKENGLYEKVTNYPGGRCKKGNEFCTEVYIVTSMTQKFSDANCTIRVKIEYEKGFTCL